MPPKRAAAAAAAAASTHRITKPRASAAAKKKSATKAAPSSTPSSNPPSSSSDPSSSDPIYFWKPHQAHGYLGQWYPSPFTLDGEVYATAEMWMMVQKARLFGDEEVAARMLATTDPAAHKWLGREVRGFDGGVWDEHKLRIVIEGNVHKFTISEEAEKLREMLLATGERELVEASPRDRIWGIGFGAERAGRERKRWGKNLLGVALMDVRGKLRKQEKGEGEKEGEE